MKRLTYSSIEEFCCEAVDVLDTIAENDEFEDVSIICKYESARKIIRTFSNMDFDLTSIELTNPLVSFYEDEYIITICMDGDTYQVWCQPMLNEDHYLTDESSITYVLDECSAKVIKTIKSRLVLEVGFVEEDDEEECCYPECTCKENYSVNGKAVTKDEFVKFRDSIYAEMEAYVNGYRRIVDRMDDMFRLL